MTEKRFTYIYDATTGNWELHDNLLSCATLGTNAIGITRLLNELSEENEQLKEIVIEQLESALTIPFIRKEYCNVLLRVLDEEDSLESAKEYIKNFLGVSE